MPQLKTGHKPLARGFTSLEMILIIAVILTTLTVAVPLFLNKSTANREGITRKKLQAIKNAMIGDVRLLERGNRSSFGFIGDLGVLPTPPDDLNELVVRVGSRPVYQQSAINSALYFGWNGPYLDNSVNADGKYTALLDAWGEDFEYDFDLDNDLTTLDAEIRSKGANGLAEAGVAGSDDIVMSITDAEASTYVAGTFTDRDKHPIDESLVTIYYPNGNAALASMQITPNPADKTKYDSRVDAVSTALLRKIPIGNRFFETGTHQIKKLVSLNQRRPAGQDVAMVNFVSLGSAPSEPEFERNFLATDNTDPSSGSPITSLMGTWQSDGNGNFYADGGAGEYRAGFGSTAWQDYRIEVDATLIQGRGYGIYYRSNGQANITAYCFQYDPGLTGGGQVAFVVRKVVNGGEQAPFQSVIMTLAQFPNVYNASHHTSITVQGTRHIIKVDGNPVFDFIDNSFMAGQIGLRSWDGNRYTNFHHLRVHAIPPLPSKEHVWWSFEEGSGTRVYGSGFLIDAPEINGTINNLTNIYRRWQNTNIMGRALYTNGSNSSFVNYNDVLNFNPTDAFSMSAWIRIDTITANSEYVIISKIQQGNERGWKLYLAKSSGNNFGARFAFQQTSNSQQLIRHNNLEITSAKWFHVLVTYNGSGFSGDIDPSALNIYVTPYESNTIQSSPSLINISTGLRSSSNSSNSGSLLIGAQISGSNPFNGSIDEVRVFQTALTASERNQIFQKEK